MIISRTPLRLSLVGGGTDVPAFYEQSPGAVVSFAINHYVYVSVNKKFDGKFRVSYSTTENVDTADQIQHDLVRNALKRFKMDGGLEVVSVADIPGEGTGLGSSSAFTVGLLNALNWHYQADYIHPAALAEQAFEVEQAEHPGIGKQDQYAAAYGGFNFIRFESKKVEVWKFDIQPNFEDWFLLLYTGITRKADDMLQAQSNAFREDRLKIGKGMALLAEEFRNQYISGKIHIGELLHENWILKTCIHKDITNSQVNTWYTLARANGALGGKLCGAGGGGFMLFYAPPDSHKKITEVTGLRRVDFKIEKEGSKIIYG